MHPRPITAGSGQGFSLLAPIWLSEVHLVKGFGVDPVVIMDKTVSVTVVDQQLILQVRVFETCADAEACDVPPILSSAAVWSPILPIEEIGREEAIQRRADHRVPEAGRRRHGGQGSVPQARVLGGQLLPLA